MTSAGSQCFRIFAQTRRRMEGRRRGKAINAHSRPAAIRVSWAPTQARASPKNNVDAKAEQGGQYAQRGEEREGDVQCGGRLRGSWHFDLLAVG